MSKHRTHSPEFKARVATKTISSRKTIKEISADHDIQQIPAPLVGKLTSLHPQGCLKV